MKGSMLYLPSQAGGFTGWWKERRAFFFLALATWLCLWLAKKFFGIE